tara:strand:+ start:351 stop:533 length:183 start_codon:yes stop_codon:yes gene_type:complete
MSDNKKNNKSWVAVVYDGTDKINSRIFYGNEEEIVRPEALRWVIKLYGEKTDWSLHEINK